MILFICAVLLQVIYFICTTINSYKRYVLCVTNNDWKGARVEGIIQFSIMYNAMICALLNYMIYLLIK